MIHHLQPTKRTDYLAAMPSNHAASTRFGLGSLSTHKNMAHNGSVLHLFEVGGISVPPIQELLPVKRTLAEALPMRGGKEERVIFSNKIDAGLCTIGPRRISNNPPAPRVHNPRHMARDYRSETDGDNGSRSLTQSCHSVMKKNRELDEEVSGN